MNSTLLGEPSVFAIEHEMHPRIPLLGAVRLWAGNLWLGDIENSMLLGNMCERLNALRGPRRDRSRLLFTDESGVPTFDDLRGGSHWSFGESFDDFDFVYYAVGQTETIHWIWQADEIFKARYPDYPLQLHHARVPFHVYDAIVGRFLKTLGVPDDVEPQVAWRFDPRDAYRERP